MPTYPDKLDRIHAQVLVVDMQERLLPHIHEIDTVRARISLLLQAMRVLNLPVTITVQNPERLGLTDPAVVEHAATAPILNKMTFSVCNDAKGKNHLLSLMRPQVVLVGVETHVCVQQTALDLLRMQLRPFVLADAVSSRRPLDRDVALARMREAGVIVSTVEATIFELLHEAGTDAFRKILPLLK